MGYCQFFIFCALVAFPNSFAEGYSFRNSKIGRTIISVREEVDFNVSTAVSQNPELDGLAADPDENAEVTTWFPEITFTSLDPESNVVSDPSLSSRGILTPELRPLSLTFSNQSTDYNITWSGCASVGSTQVGYWMFENGTNATATWYDIMQDAKANYKQYGGLGNALDAGTIRNYDAMVYEMSPAIANWLRNMSETDQQATGAVQTNGGIQGQTSPGFTSQVTGPEYLDTMGHIELRKLQADTGFRPNWRAVAILLATAVSGFGIISGFSISGNGATGANLTYNNFQGGLAVFCFVIAGAVIGWLFSPAFRKVINRLTASATMSQVREQALRTRNQLAGLQTSDSGTTGGGSAGGVSVADIGTVFDSETANTLGEQDLSELGGAEQVQGWLENFFGDGPTNGPYQNVESYSAAQDILTQQSSGDDCPV